MDDNLENRPVETTPAPEFRSDRNPDVGFPLSQHKPKSKSGVWIFIIVLIIILAGGLVFFLSKGKSNTPEPSPTPEEGINIETSTSTPIPSPISTPSTADKAKVVIEIQNGTGISGEAAYLQGILKGMNYTNLKVGNSSSQDNVSTAVTFSDTLDKSIVQEITTQLDLIYQQVDTQTSSSLKTDVLIVTGLKKGATAKPVASVSPSPSPSVTP